MTHATVEEHDVLSEAPHLRRSIPHPELKVLPDEQPHGLSMQRNILQNKKKNFRRFLIKERRHSEDVSAKTTAIFIVAGVICASNRMG